MGATTTPLSDAEVSKLVNPEKLPEYKGPTGAISGTVTITGDSSPLDTKLDIPAKCKLARDMYAPLFREGMMRSLADALVAVTGYPGYVPARTAAVKVEANGCAWHRRTYALTVGQHLEISSSDSETYMPRLLGARQPATLVLVPRGDPIKLYPDKPGRYVLSDSVHPFMFAEVLALRFATVAVTGLDGKYEITGIPAGEVTVNAALPVIQQTVEKKVQIVAGKTTEVDFAIPFDRKAWEGRSSVPAPAASAQPAPSKPAPADK